MVTIRLARAGAKKKPFYRVVVADARYSRDGRFIEQLGWYDPLKNPGLIKFDLDKIDAWLSKGAQPTDTARKLIDRHRKEAAAAPAGAV